MKKQTLAYLLAAALLLAACTHGALAAPAKHPRDACPVTPPDDLQTRLYGPEDGLQVFISGDGIWENLPMGITESGPPDKAGFINKVFWRYPGYDWREDPMPDFILIGEQLDGDGHFEQPGPATNAFAESLLGSAILTGVGIPNRGCWQLTGHYRGSQLSFVVWVGGSD